MSEHSHGEGRATVGGAGRWIFWGFVLVAAFFLIAEHRAHVIQYLPFLLLAACPLMHLFHRHGTHHRETAGNDAQAGKGKDGDKHAGGCH